MLMYGYGVGKSFAPRKDEEGASLWPIFLGGCAGGFVQSFLQSPIELLKVRMQLAALGQVPSVGALTLQLLRPATATAGLNATLLRDVVPHGVWFSAYEWSKTQLKCYEARRRPPTLVFGAGSGGSKEALLSTPSQLAAGSFAAVRGKAMRQTREKSWDVIPARGGRKAGLWEGFAGRADSLMMLTGILFEGPQTLIRNSGRKQKI